MTWGFGFVPRYVVTKQNMQIYADRSKHYVTFVAL